jgi:hypothetical protein
VSAIEVAAKGVIDVVTKKATVAATKAFGGGLNLGRHVWAGAAKLPSEEAIPFVRTPENSPTQTE